MIPSEYWVREEFDHELMRMITKVAKFTVVYHHGPYYGPLEPKMYRKIVDCEGATIPYPNPVRRALK